MRILYHHRTLADGAEGVHIAEMVNAFEQLGHEVRVAGVAGATGSQARKALVTRLRSLVPAHVFELAALSVNVGEYVQLQHDLRAFGADLLYKRHARYDVAALLAARRAGIPAVLEANVLFSRPPYVDFEPLAFRRLAERMERKALELATVVIAVSSPLAQDIRNITRANVVVVPNGADPDRFDSRRANAALVRARHSLRAGLTMGWSGILREWHGLDLLLRAMAGVPSAQLLIVGDGPWRTEVERQATVLGVAERVVLTGRVPHADMPHYLAAMDIAVVADERTGVASPMKLVEYMAMGRAVVAPRLQNIRDLITDGVDGLLFAPGDSGDLGRVLQRLAADETLRRTLGRQARQKVELERNWRCVAEMALRHADVQGGSSSRLRMAL